MLVQGAHYILGPFGQDIDLRRIRLLGTKASCAMREKCKESGRYKAVSRKLRVLLGLWVGGRFYEHCALATQSMRGRGLEDASPTKRGG